MLILVSLTLLLVVFAAENFSLRAARRAIPIRIHVNGTRGKSTVTRLIAAALREAGIHTLAKVTGTEPRLIFADGSEAPIKRRGPANIREQMWFLKLARRRGVRAIVVECMAVRPDLQWTSEHRMLRSTIGVITNARLDHTEEMGQTVEAIAQSLANTTPAQGVLVAPFVTNVRPSVPVRERPPAPVTKGIDDLPFWLQENVAIALAVTRHLNIDDEVALRGMRKATPDPGAASAGTAAINGREVEWLNATAANDPQSLDELVVRRPTSNAQRQTSATSDDLIVYNHRSDRPARLLNFARASVTFRSAAHIVLTGDRPALSLNASVARLCRESRVQFVERQDLVDAIASLGSRRVLFCGNTRGFENPLRQPC